MQQWHLVWSFSMFQNTMSNIESFDDVWVKHSRLYFIERLYNWNKSKCYMHVGILLPWSWNNRSVSTIRDKREGRFIKRILKRMPVNWYMVNRRSVNFVLITRLSRSTNIQSSPRHHVFSPIRKHHYKKIVAKHALLWQDNHVKTLKRHEKVDYPFLCFEFSTPYLNTSI